MADQEREINYEAARQNQLTATNPTTTTRSMPGTIRKNSNGGYIVDVTMNGQRKTAKCRLKKDADKKKSELIQSFKNSYEGKKSTSRIRLDMTIEEGQKLVLDRKYKNMASYDSVQGGLNKLLYFYGRDFKLKDINSENFFEYTEDGLAQDILPSTLNKHRGYLLQVFSIALVYGKIRKEEIPILPPRLRDVKRPKRIFSKEEESFFINYWRKCGYEQLADLYQWSIDLCARWGEGQKLRSGDVDLKNGLVTFRQPKNTETRTVAMTKRAIECIRPWVSNDKREHVWQGEGLKYHQLRRLIDQVKSELGLEEDKALTWHSCRHTGATRIAQAGVSLSELMAFGGWKSLASVQCYLHLDTKKLSRCVAAREEALN